MVHIRSSPSSNSGERKHRYECKRCIVDYTEVDRANELAPDRARKLDRAPIFTLQ